MAVLLARVCGSIATGELHWGAAAAGLADPASRASGPGCAADRGAGGGQGRPRRSGDHQDHDQGAGHDPGHAEDRHRGRCGQEPGAAPGGSPRQPAGHRGPSGRPRCPVRRRPRPRPGARPGSRRPGAVALPCRRPGAAVCPRCDSGASAAAVDPRGLRRAQPVGPGAPVPGLRPPRGDAAGRDGMCHSPGRGDPLPPAGGAVRRGAEAAREARPARWAGMAARWARDGAHGGRGLAGTVDRAAWKTGPRGVVPDRGAGRRCRTRRRRSPPIRHGRRSRACPGPVQLSPPRPKALRRPAAGERVRLSP